jgi:hypothetical protein
LTLLCEQRSFKRLSQLSELPPKPLTRGQFHQPISPGTNAPEHKIELKRWCSILSTSFTTSAKTTVCFRDLAKLNLLLVVQF